MPAPPRAPAVATRRASCAVERAGLPDTSPLHRCQCSAHAHKFKRVRAYALPPAGIAGVAAEVEALLGEARQLSEASPEPLQSLASLRQQQGRDEEALALLRQSLALWFKPTPEESDSEGEEGQAEAKKAGKVGSRCRHAMRPR